MKKFSKIQEEFNFALEELSRMFPSDQYGIAVQFRSKGKYTKWISVNKEFLDTFEKLKHKFESAIVDYN